MKSHPETGHAKNVQNLSSFVYYLSTLGNEYNPSSPDISLSAMTTLLTTAQEKLQRVKVTYWAWKSETNKREIVYDQLNPLCSRLLSALKSSGVSPLTVDDLHELVIKMRGQRATAKPVAEKNESGTEDATEQPATRSSARTSFDSKREHFNKIILLLSHDAQYNPNEVELQVSTLQNLLVEMATTTTNANLAYIQLGNARMDRNSLFYGEETGMLDRVKKSKAYLASIFGAKSAQYKSALVFRFIRVVTGK